ncbi:hypothetical protein INT47_006088 [Mucor saturninus]|uniref:Uncharacterized protein n=1 Tax=Mucor saturninus TaxID=64648 RepID=A0A8H7RCP2_9FUNG|nr:hypothetical protein INT47_006088 [Mucor saturninus]
MDYQLTSVQNQRAPKRRMDEEDEEVIVTKRYFDLHTQFSPDLPAPEKDLPAITYASPDYRPPPPKETPLWLQPVAAPSPMTEDDSEDESVMTPSYQHQQKTNKPLPGYWGDMSISPWQPN